MTSRCLQSLLVSAVVSFVAVLVVIGVLVLPWEVLSWMPEPIGLGMAGVGLGGLGAIANFLAVFGQGSSLHGVITICLTVSFVGVLFDSYVFYHKVVAHKIFSHIAGLPED
jgi:hypothetical protein